MYYFGRSRNEGFYTYLTILILSKILEYRKKVLTLLIISIMQILKNNYVLDLLAQSIMACTISSTVAFSGIIATLRPFSSMAFLVTPPITAMATSLR